ncbi:hypothetical protein MFLO_10039 [Listeria floridensis FSL S10-1187]|uniref:Uncharacterized protein n=1 Tax=Listeria floridensis FSL S10-1187 TaxID=1265817 RepID=A0ABP3AYQ0_9LIST|nr:Lmo0850 family protein [Listeria floridensis]EUJ30734.1 hypothetical protein MFLO_10039 [Listeria floridensis FSL S10-1187]
MKENRNEMDKVIQNLKLEGITVEKTKSRKEIWQKLQVKPMPKVELSLR